MILVTGTKRSGTSMWMQILRASGFEVLGDAFPRDWQDVIGAANPEGFFESRFRQGIYYRTNPDPRTGAFLRPEDSRRSVVKVFVPGLIRSDLAFVDHVLGTMRNWREYHGSLRRLYELEEANRPPKTGAPRRYLTPTWEWWRENFSLLSDFLTRRYKIHMVAYDTVLERPDEVIPEALEWLGGGDVDAALAAVRPTLRTHRAEALEAVPEVEPEVAAVFDELYARVRDRKGLDAAFIETLNQTNERIAPRIEQELKELRRERARRQMEAARRKNEREPGESE
jgi:hypothetical protein